MSTSSYILTEEMVELYTEEVLGTPIYDTEQENDDQETIIENSFFKPISTAEETAMYFSLLTVGLILNSIILRCYWKEKSATSTYFKAFAVFDMLALMIRPIDQIILILGMQNPATNLTRLAMQNLIAAVYNVGSLFLALDRCLVVAFPHNFREHEGKLRWIKGGMLLFLGTISVMTSTFYVVDPTWVLTDILRVVAILAIFVQIVAIVALYTIIIVKVVTSDRKMKNSRHFGNK